MPSEGEVIGFTEIGRLRSYLPRELWAHRRYAFFRGMRLEIGPAHRDYSPAAAYVAATARYQGESRLGPAGTLEGYTAGQPFPMQTLRCSDPDAGQKIIWNYDHQWEGDGDHARFRYTYWDRGRRLDSYFEGSMTNVHLAHRVEEKWLAKAGGDLFRQEQRKSAVAYQLEAPRTLRGLRLVGHRLKAEPGLRPEQDRFWIYTPGDGQVTELPQDRPWQSLPGSDLVFENMRGFSGIVTNYHWKCLREEEIFAPVNTRVQGYPLDPDHSFGPLGLSYANDRWELRKVVVLRMTPKHPDHHYGRKLLYLDRQTLRVLYSFAYDVKDEMWQISWHVGRWSEDDELYYSGWEEVPSPRDAKTVGDVMVNVQLDTGRRVELWDNHGTPTLSRRGLRSFFDPYRRASH